MRVDVYERSLRCAGSLSHTPEDLEMGYTLNELASDIRQTLKAEPGPSGQRKVCALVSRALNDAAFVQQHLLDWPDDTKMRRILYQDPELGFCICGHYYRKPFIGKPHDHGQAWAIYGQAVGSTEMTDWSIVEKGEGEQPTLVELSKVYELEPGMAHLYEIGNVHSPKTTEETRLIRIESSNLDLMKRSNIKARAA